MEKEIKNFSKLVVILSLALLALIGCTSTSSTSSEASEVLEGQILNIHSGNGPEQLTFVNDGLLVTEAGNIKPVMDEDEEQIESETSEYDSVDLVDGEDGEYIVEYDGEDLYRFRMNEDNLLEAEDGTLYFLDGPTE